MDAVVAPAGSGPRPHIARRVVLAGFAIAALALGFLMPLAIGPLRFLGRGGAKELSPSEEAPDGDKATDGQAEDGDPPALDTMMATDESTAELEAVGPDSEESPRRLQRLRGPAGWAIYLAIIIGAILFGPSALGWALNSDYPLATISSNSMWPALKEGDIVLLRGVDSPEDLDIGDIVAFRHGEGLAIHRVVEIDGFEITTRGDANTRLDDPIAFENVIGKVQTVGGYLARIPYLGHLSFILGPLVNATVESAEPPGAPEAAAAEISP